MKKFLLSALFLLFIFAEIKASDTIPPVFHFYKGKLIRIPIGGVFAYKPAYWVSDNQTDSPDIVVTETWGYNGQVNTLIKKIYPLYLVASDTNGNKSYDTAIYMVDDTIPPVINLNTPDEICVLYRSSYNSVQPTVTDNYYNKNQISLTRLSSDVNTNVIGIYTEVYEAIDGSGNRTTKIRIVKVQYTCNNVGIKTSLKDRIKVYPIPSEGTLNIDGLNGTDFTLTILDMNGKTVLYSKNNESLDVSDLTDGLYLIQIEIGSEKILIKYTIGL